MNATPDRLLPPLLLALTAVTGFVDAVSYLALGHVFTANMTGNIVFLGFAMAAVPGLSVARSGAALGAFAVGAIGGGRLAARMGGVGRQRCAGMAFGIESILLFAAAGVARGAGADADLLQDPARLYPLIALTGLAMGVRNAAVRKLAERDLTTTVLTLTITGLAADSSLAGGENPGWPRRASSVGLMFAGALAGAWLLRYSLALPIAVSGAISGVCALAAYGTAGGSGSGQ
jgi:uncharacterized membrane protein YoaK (UPF0700 family)